jgi:YD repeat-containing protein
LNYLAGIQRWIGKDGKPPTLSDLLEQSRKHLEYTLTHPRESTTDTSSPYNPSRTFVTTIAQFQYAYDGNRNIQARTYPSGYQSFTYDDYDRLTQATMPNGTYTYTYDSRSNRLTMRFVNTAQTQDETTTYTYSVDDRMVAYTVYDNILQTTIRNVAYTYDNAGNTTQRVFTENGIPETTTYAYYDDNRIHTVTLPSSEVITFTYFADGSRATKESGTEWITYHYATGLVKEVHHLASDHNTTTFTLHYEPGRIIYEPYGGTSVTYYTVTDTQAQSTSFWTYKAQL